jgi:phosphoglycolate phosphatase
VQTELVIFDFDGTLVDTAPDLIRATNIFLESEGFEPLSPARIRSEIGLGLRRFLKDIYPIPNITPERERELFDNFTSVYEREFLKTPVLFEGALEFLHTWPGKFAIVSNKRTRFITPILEHLGIAGLGWVSIIGGDTFAQMKPHPQPFLHAMDAAGSTPDETVIVGDGIPDVQGAINVGSRCVAVDFGYTPADQLMDLGAWKRLGSFTELNSLIGN